MLDADDDVTLAPPATAATEDVWAGWEKWLRAHLDIEKDGLIEDLGIALGVVRNELLDQIEPQAQKISALEPKISALELKVAELSGAVDILRGKQAPPPAKFPSVKAWRKDVVYYAADVVAFDGGCYQAVRDTAQAPGTRDWICLSVRGRDGASITIRGTWEADADYRQLDVVACNGGSFVARCDKPGPCPGPGWQLLASPGKRGLHGPAGERGPQGPPLAIQAWHIDPAKSGIRRAAAIAALKAARPLVRTQAR